VNDLSVSTPGLKAVSFNEGKAGLGHGYTYILWMKGNIKASTECISAIAFLSDRTVYLALLSDGNFYLVD